MATNNTTNTHTSENTAEVLGGPGIFGFFMDDKPQYPKNLHPYPESYNIYLPKDKLHPVSEWKGSNTSKQTKTAEAHVIEENVTTVVPEAPIPEDIKIEEEKHQEADQPDMEVENDG